MLTSLSIPFARTKGASAGWRRVLTTCLAAVVLLGVASARAAEPPPLEYQVKAAFLVKFGLFIESREWSAADAAKEPFTIGILGDDPFGDYFDKAVNGELVNGHPIRIQRARYPEELSGCQIVFISASESARLDALLARLAGQPMLTVADEPDFARRGGMIGFIKESGKVRFEINLRAAEKARLKLSSKLLQVGKIVTPAAEATGG
jgi:hypothetical protein